MYSQKLALIVLIYNTANECIRNIDLVMSRNDYLQIVIVDNASTDNSYETLKAYYGHQDNVHVIESGKNGGYSFGNNVGVRYIIEKYHDIEYIGIMNPDVRCDSEGLFSKMISALESVDKIALVSPMMIQHGELKICKIGWKLPGFSRLVQNHMLWTQARFRNRSQYDAFPVNGNGTIAYCDVVQGSLFVIKRQVFEDVGLFDENVFLYTEENILAHKLKKAGYREGFLLTEQYIHEHDFDRSSLRKRKLTMRRKFDSEKYYARKYLNLNLVQRFILAVLSWFCLNIEIYVWEWLHGLKRAVKMQTMR